MIVHKVVVHEKELNKTLPGIVPPSLNHDPAFAPPSTPACPYPRPQPLAAATLCEENAGRVEKALLARLSRSFLLHPPRLVFHTRSLPRGDIASFAMAVTPPREYEDIVREEEVIQAAAMPLAEVPTCMTLFDRWASCFGEFSPPPARLI